MRLRIVLLMIGMCALVFTGQAIGWDYGGRYEHDRGGRFHEHHREHSFIHFYYTYPEDRYYYYDYPVYNRNVPVYHAGLAITDIVNMATQGLPDDVIINEIVRTGSVFHLTSQVIAYLKNNHVSDKVIDYMLTTGSSGSLS